MDDLISRQAAIEAIQRFAKMVENDNGWKALHRDDVKKILMDLPSAQPDCKTGRWKKSYADHEAFGVRPFFRYCSECHEATVYPYNFCPNCGAKMED